MKTLIILGILLYSRLCFNVCMFWILWKFESVKLRALRTKNVLARQGTLRAYRPTYQRVLRAYALKY